MIELAKQIIEKAFAGKVDKAGEPYINHLYRVGSRENFFPTVHFTELHTIALLHDILEDCPEWNETSLRVLFPDVVVDAIVALTHKEGQSYDDYITQVLGNKFATQVKRRDLEDNMNITRLKELNEWDLKRIQKYHKAYIRVTDALKEWKTR